jgi:hypothetical protein
MFSMHCLNSYVLVSSTLNLKLIKHKFVTNSFFFLFHFSETLLCDVLMALETKNCKDKWNNLCINSWSSWPWIPDHIMSHDTHVINYFVHVCYIILNDIWSKDLVLNQYIGYSISGIYLIIKTFFWLIIYEKNTTTLKYSKEGKSI